MAQLGHLELLKQGPDALRGWHKTARVNDRLDFTGHDFSGWDFTEYPLQKADFRGATLNNAIFHSANLTSALFSPLDEKVTSALSADFTSAQLHGTQFQQADLRMNPEKGIPTSFEEAKIQDAMFNYAQLNDAVFDSAELQNVYFTQAQMSRVILYAATIHANFGRATLSGAIFSRSIMNGTVLNLTMLDKADFLEASINDCHFDNAKGLESATYLATTTGNPYDFDRCYRKLRERWADWERIQVFGRLPLFGISYIAIAFIILYMHFIAFYNQSMIAPVRGWAEGVVERTEKESGEAGESAVHRFASQAKEKLRYIRPTWDTWAILFSTAFLAVASTLNAVFCPDRVRDFTSAQWVHQLGKPLQHYWADAWTYPRIRVVCMACYWFGAIIGVLLIGWRMLWVGWSLISGAYLPG